MTTKVLALDIHADIYGARLRKLFPDVQVLEARDRSELPADVSDIDVLLAFGLAINDDLMRRMIGLKWVQSLATGVDHFLRAPLAPGVLITSGRGIHGPPMREMVIYLMMTLSHGAIGQVEDKKAHVWDRRFWSLLYGKTAVVVGIGVAGVAVGEMLRAFGMHVIGVTRTPRAIAGFDEIIPTERLHVAAARADYLVGILPASKENIGLIGTNVFSAMKQTAYFVNVGRGETADEAALIAALKEGRIAGAALDVFKTEPLPADSPLWDMPNVYMTPHLGGYFIEYEEFVLPIIEENMRLFLAGRTQEMRNLVATTGATTSD
jgi:phosphoglycerate dehydrogenase-like enzyme